MSLIKEVENLRNSKVREIVEKRLSEFAEFKRKKNEEWFSELCFCLLTANSKAKTAINIQKELGFRGFSEFEERKISEVIRRNKHRFHNNKAKFIVLARENIDIKNKIEKLVVEGGEKEAREFLVRNIKGLGYKESSHFLRNVGYTNLSILDRHILNLMVENNYLSEKPRSLNRKVYFEVEDKFNEIAEKLGMSSAELDLYMWYLKTGEVLK